MAKNAKILVVDDRPQNIRLVEMVLEDMGHEILSATSGEAALRVLEQAEVAVILLDVRMPGMDGFETAQAIRQREETSSTPIIFLTADSSDDDMRRGYQLGAVDYLQKPFEPDILLWKVNVLVDLYIKSKQVQHLEEIERLNQQLHLANSRLETVVSQLKSLDNLRREIGQAHSTQEIIELIAATPLANAPTAGLMIVYEDLLEHETPSILVVQAECYTPASRFAWTADQGILCDLCQGDQPTLLNRPMEQDAALDQAFSATGIQTAAVFPMTTNQVKLGCITLHWDHDPLLTDQDMSLLQGVVDQAAGAVYSLLLLAQEREARELAEQAEKLKMDFLAMVSHELRTPLTSIKGFTTTLLADDVVWDDTTQRDFLGIINEESENLLELINQLLDLSRLEAGKLLIEKETCRVSSIIQSIEPQLVMLTANHYLAMDIPANLPLVEADRRRIAQVVTNLIGNAAKYAPQATPIRLTAQRVDRTVQIAIEDAGPGIPPDQREAVFQAFRQLKPSMGQQAGGAGLGLAIAKGLIEAHGGLIWVADHGPPGTRMVFSLPTK